MSLADDVVLAVETYSKTNNKAEAARLLGIPVTTLKHRLDIAARSGDLCQKNGVIRGSQIANTPKRHCVIPDVQAKPGVPLDHLNWAGKYIAEKKPDVIVCIGDFADMRSLSRYNTRREEEGQRVADDFKAARKAMRLLMEPIKAEKNYNPRLVMVPGNHEIQIDRFLEENPKLIGMFGPETLGYEEWGWEIIEYLKPVCIDGVWYCHYFYNPDTGKPYGGTNLQTRLQTIGHSFTMGHQQGLKTAIRDLSNGTRQRGLVCGSFYQHVEKYKGPQGNGHWHGIIMKNEVKDGNYDITEVSLNYLRRKYG